MFNSPLRILLVVLSLSVATIYSLPNFFGNSPALQISEIATGIANDITQLALETALEEIGLENQAIIKQDQLLFVRFETEEDQIQAHARLQKALGNEYAVALHLVPNSPDWLRALGAKPMPLGLDLRGGVHFLLRVDTNAALSKTADNFVSDIKTLLREEKIRYIFGKQEKDSKTKSLLFSFTHEENRSKAKKIISEKIAQFEIEERTNGTNEYLLHLVMTASQQTEFVKNAVQQNVTILRNRVNELGIAEPLVQQQGRNNIIVELPGVQDIARAKQILGETATLNFHLVDPTQSETLSIKRAPIGSKIRYGRNGETILLKKQIVISGEQIINATSGIDPESNLPNVNITLDAAGGAKMRKITRQNVGQDMAVVFIHRKRIANTDTTEQDASEQFVTKEEVINVARIQEEFGRRFHITGLDSSKEAKDLALLLRAGALAAPADIVEERTVGPSLGKQNVERGLQSGFFGLILVFCFMIFRYKYLGLLGNIALFCNLLLLIALLSLLQATLTLPGIAGIILTLGMAIDANVLIYERIREELRTGASPRAAIKAGFSRAYLTIIDANITTLIAALALFNFGSGPIKGFAITLSLGILTSIFSAIYISRTLVNISFRGNAPIKKLWV